MTEQNIATSLVAVRWKKTSSPPSMGSRMPNPFSALQSNDLWRKQKGDTIMVNSANCSSQISASLAQTPSESSDPLGRLRETLARANRGAVGGGYCGATPPEKARVRLSVCGM